MHARAARHDRHFGVCFDPQLQSVAGIDFNVGVGGVKRAQHSGFGGARVGVPLR